MTPSLLTRPGVRRVGLVSLLVIGILPRGAAAQVDGATTTARNAVQVTPYLWGAGLSGLVQPSVAASWVVVRRSAGDLLQDLDAAVFVSALARRDRWVVVGDVSATRASRAGLVPTGNPALPAVRAEATLRQTSLTLAGGYRVVQSSTGSLDLLAGARAWWLRPAIAAPPVTTGRSAASDLVDPIVAARGTVVLTPAWRLLAYGDVGGFGAGSDATRQLVLTANARVARRVWLSGGYRALAVDHAARGARVDASLHGPLLGGTFSF
jgi:hypothetical protein